MPNVYLSPSLQENTFFAGGGTEKYYMNLIADDMVSALEKAGIEAARSKAEMTARQVIEDSNSARRDLYLAIRSRTAPPDEAGKEYGADFYYRAASTRSREFAENMAKSLNSIYKEENVRARPDATLAELTRISAPSVVVVIGCHSISAQARLIRENIREIAKLLAESIICILAK